MSKRKNLFGLFLILSIAFLPLRKAEAMEIKADKDVLENYGLQEYALNVKPEKDVSIEIESRLINNKNETINTSTILKDLEAYKNLDVKNYMQIVPGAYAVEISVKDANSGKNLGEKIVLEIEGAEKSVVEIINPTISLNLDEEFNIEDYSIELVLNDGSKIKANLTTEGEKTFSSNEKGTFKKKAHYVSEDSKYEGDIELVFEVDEYKQIESMPNVTKVVQIGEEVSLPTSVKVIYKDGSFAMKKVDWMDEPDTSKAHVQKIQGRIHGSMELATIKLIVEDYDLDDEYIFKNEEIKEEVIEKLGKDKVTYRDLLEIKDLNLSYASDDNLEDLNYFKNLESFELTFGFIGSRENPTDYSPLSGLTNLKNLDLFNSNVGSVDFLENLVKLEELNLGSNNIVDISAIKNLTNLKILNLTGNNGIRDIKALRWTKDLSDLNLPLGVRDYTPIIEYNENLRSPYDIELIKGRDSRLEHEVKVDEEYYLPYAVEMDSEIRYVDWQEEKVLVDKEKAISGRSGSDEFIFVVKPLVRPDEDVIEIKDPVFEAEVRKSIDKKFGDITFADIKNLKLLDLSAKEIKDYSGLENFVGLENFKVWASPNFKNSDLEKIKGMKNLQLIDLGSTGVSVIKSDTFKGLDQLIEIALDDNKLYEIPDNAFVTNTSLKWLHLNGTEISELNFLQGLDNLESLYADDNRLNNISGLKYTPNLKMLDLSGNNLTDVKEVSNLVKLDTLRLNRNRITSLDVSNLTNLDTLWLNNNQISDISSFKNLSKLRILYMDNNYVSDVTPLSGLSELSQVQLRNNRISDVSPLKNLNKLKVLWLRGNPVQNLDSLLPIYDNLTNTDFEL